MEKMKPGRYIRRPELPLKNFSYLIVNRDDSFIAYAEKREVRDAGSKTSDWTARPEFYIRVSFKNYYEGLQ